MQNFAKDHYSNYNAELHRRFSSKNVYLSEKNNFVISYTLMHFQPLALAH